MRTLLLMALMSSGVPDAGAPSSSAHARLAKGLEKQLQRSEVELREGNELTIVIKQRADPARITVVANCR